MTMIEELRQRGMIHDVIPGTEELLESGKTAGYIGFDPTAASLHIGSLVQIILLMHLQKHGHKAIALVGGATGMIGDPSGKSEERNFLSEEAIQHNVDGIKAQLSKFLSFEGENAAEIVNNADWFGKMGFLEFLREAGKLITVNYMMAKDSVQKRLETGLSFTEFSYQLVQGYDFFHLYKNKGCKLQMGGSDQWGNIVAGTEFIRRKVSGEAFAFTCPLITKADGSKFGKSEQGNVWLDANLTSPYHFYQFWLNVADADAVRYIKIFTFLPLAEIAELEKQHAEAPHLRILQKKLAEEVTVMVHGVEEYQVAIILSEILFDSESIGDKSNLQAQHFEHILKGLNQFTISKSLLKKGIDIVDLLATHTKVFASKGEARKMIAAGGVTINKDKVQLDQTISENNIIYGRYLLPRKGKKNYSLISVDELESVDNYIINYTTMTLSDISDKFDNEFIYKSNYNNNSISIRLDFLNNFLNNYMKSIVEQVKDYFVNKGYVVLDTGSVTIFDIPKLSLLGIIKDKSFQELNSKVSVFSQWRLIEELYNINELEIN